MPEQTGTPSTPNLQFVEALSDGRWGHFSAAELRTLAQINQKVAAAPTLEQLVEFLFDNGRGVFPCDRIALAFFEEQGRRLVAHHVVANYQPLRLGRGYTESLSGSSLERVLRDGVPRIINDLPRYFAEHPQSSSSGLLVAEGVHSSMTCPLVLEGRVIAVLFRSSRRPESYSEGDARKQRAISERLAQVIHKVRRIELLGRSEMAYLRVLDFVGAEIPDTVTSMLATIEALQGEGEVVPERQAELDALLAQGRHLLRQLNDFHELRRIDREELALDALDAVDLAAAVLTPALALARPQLDACDMSVELQLPQEPQTVSCDPQLLTRVVLNLLSNAARYGLVGGSVQLSLEQAPESFTIRVHNEGVGFTEERRQRLFRRFDRLDPTGAGKGSRAGIGLYIAWQLVVLHGGQLKASSDPGQWAEFSLTIPQPLPMHQPARP